MSPPWWPNAEQAATVAVGTLRWHLVRRGIGPTVLFLHGTGAGGFSFAPLLDALGARVHAVVPDLPGHAFTRPAGPPDDAVMALPAMADALEALLDALALTPDAIVGHSAGAALALELAVRGRVPATRVLGLNPALVPPPAAYGWLARWWVGPLAEAAVLARGAAWLAPRLGLADTMLDATGSAVPPVLRRCYAHCLADPAHLHGALAMMARWDLPALLARATARAFAPHLLHGADDAWVPLAALRRVLASTLPAATLEVVPGGHLVHEADPALVAARLEAVLGHAPIAAASGHA
jgi:magnesium chelatase accessory protein